MKEYYNEEKVRIAFSNVKEDISNLKKEIELIKLELLEIKDKISFNNKDSKGNKGVVTTRLQHAYNTLTTNKQQIDIETMDKNLKDLDDDIKKIIFSLSNKQFLVFITIYQQEDELKKPVTYTEIAIKLNVSESYLRGCIRELISKGVPIIKQKSSNKIFLSIKKEFRSLKIGDKLIDFKRFFSNQTNLSEDFNL